MWKANRPHSNSPRPADGLSRSSAFTLIEVLLVISIIAVLASLVFPAYNVAFDRARNIKCVNNLRQIGISVFLWSNDNGNVYPEINSCPNDIVYPNGKSFLETLGAYGVTEKTLQCPSDLLGVNYYAQCQSSYKWLPYASGDKINNVKFFTPFGVIEKPASEVRLASDYGSSATGGKPVAPHLDHWNALHADGHVSAYETTPE